MKTLGIAIAIATAVSAAACGGAASGSPTSPSPMPPNPVQVSFAGAWAGNAVDTSGQDRMTLGITQTGTTVAGNMTVTDAMRSMMGSGSMQGTINGTKLTFHMTVPSGGFQGTMSPCSMNIDGVADMSADGLTMTGTYTGAMSGMMSMMQSCGGTLGNGQFTMTHQ